MYAGKFPEPIGSEYTIHGRFGLIDDLKLFTSLMNYAWKCWAAQCNVINTYTIHVSMDTVGLKTEIEIYVSNYSETWWRHQTETFSALLAICAGNSPVPGEFPTQRPVTRSFDVYFDLRPNKWLSKQSWVWWFETLSCSLWRHCNESCYAPSVISICTSNTFVACKITISLIYSWNWHYFIRHL